MKSFLKFIAVCLLGYVALTAYAFLHGSADFGFTEVGALVFALAFLAL